MSFFHVAAFSQFLQYAGQETPPVVLQPHAVSDVPHAGWLRKRCEVGQNQFGSDFVRYCGFARLVGVALAGRHTVSNRLTDLPECSKESRNQLKVLGKIGRIQFTPRKSNYSCGVSATGKSSTVILPLGSRSSPGA